jgi:flagellar assembly protein FliH
VLTQLRNEAIDLAMAASKVIADEALNAYGNDKAIEAIAEACAQLRSEPEIIVTLPPEAEQGVKLRLENMPQIQSAIHYVADPNAKPGDWKIEFKGGSVSFNRDDVAQQVEACLNRRKDDPVDDQMNLFGTA